jgi:hypothetical protein
MYRRERHNSNTVRPAPVLIQPIAADDVARAVGQVDDAARRDPVRGLAAPARDRVKAVLMHPTTVVSAGQALDLPRSFPAPGIRTRGLTRLSPPCDRARTGAKVTT